MKNSALICAAILPLAGPIAVADEATEQSVIQMLREDNAYTRENLEGMGDTVAAEGSLEFWSSGGLLNEIDPDTAPQEFESFNIDIKHITVITLVPGQIAVAQYYSDGSMHPKSSAAVSNYRTRVTQVLVKEGGRWKVRAAHWSPIAGGAGTSATAVLD